MGLIDEKKTGSVSKSEGVEAEFRSIAGKETTDVLRDLSCNEQGINDDEREKRLEKYGYNDLSANQKHSWVYFIVHSFTDAFIIVLLILSLVTFVVEKDIVSGVIILALACMSAVIRFVQDYGSYCDMQKLKEMEHDTVRIQVPGKNGLEVREVSVEEVVPGDIQLIGSGDIVCGVWVVLQLTQEQVWVWWFVPGKIHILVKFPHPYTHKRKKRILTAALLKLQKY